MLIRDMINMTPAKIKEELDNAEKRVEKQSLNVKNSTNPPHRQCRYFVETEEGEDCRIMRCLYCKEEECSFEAPQIFIDDL